MTQHFVTARRGSRAGVLAVVGAIVLFGTVALAHSPAAAQGAAVLSATASKTADAPASAPVTLPEKLTREEVRALLSRISDEEARQLLLQQLDKVAAQDAADDPAAMMDVFEQSLPAIKNRLTLMVSAVGDLPSLGPLLVNKLTRDDPSRIWMILLYGALIFAGGLAVEWLFRRLFTSNIVHPQGERTSGIQKACVLGLRLIVDLLGIAVFALVALGLFFVFYQGHEPVRQAVGALYWMIVSIRAFAAVARFAVAPRAPLLRLPPIGDGTARKLYWRIVWVAASVIVAVLFLDLLEEFGVEEGLFLLVGQIVSLAVIGLVIGIIWYDRRGIAHMIEPAVDAGDEPSGPVKRLLAANWHILATCYLAGIYVFSTFQILLTGQRSTGPAITSIAVLIAIPFVDWMMQAGLRRLLRAPAKTAPETAPEMGHETLPATPGETVPDGGDAGTAAEPTDSGPDGAESEYFGVLLRNFRVVLAIVVAVAIGEIWNIDMRGAAAAGVGETVANAIFDIVITLVLASAIWGIIKTAISRQLPEKKAVAEGEAAEGGDPGGTGGTRLETLLPLFQKFLFVTLVVIVGMIILSELGVDIGPLIAGAGIVGIAIGFGAQTLVRDIVSGVFFLIEDAFRVGEYIDIGGGIRGMVEDISIRSFRLRHHNGPIHTVPFGGVKTLTNFSRDWVIMKLELRLPFETDIEKVRKIVKKVGQELMDHPEHGKNFLQPLKSQGVNRMDDSAFIFRVKFMAKPGEQFVLRREVYRRVQEALAENDIHFAPKRVIVDTSGLSPEQAKTAMAAAADAAEDDVARAG